MRFSRRPLLEAAIPGVLAYLVGYLFTYAWLGRRWATMAGDVRAVIRYGGGDGAVVSEPTLASFLADGGAAALTWTGWLFHSAHFVPFSVTVADLPAAGSTSVPNPLLAADASAAVLLFGVPPVLLVAAGALAATRAGDRERIRLGMLIVVGYLPLAVLGAFLFSVSPDIWRRGAVAPDLLASILGMGLGYPLIFGGLGGWLVERFRLTNPEPDPDEANPTSQ